MNLAVCKRVWLPGLLGLKARDKRLEYEALVAYERIVIMVALPKSQAKLSFLLSLARVLPPRSFIFIEITGILSYRPS